MVAAERMKLAETEEELREARAEKEALRSALKLVEHQRAEAESRSASPMPGHGFPASASHSHKRSTSSAIAIKSLPPSRPSSAPSSPKSMVRIVTEESSSTRAAIPPPLDLPEVGLAKSTRESHPSPPEEDAEDEAEDTTFIASQPESESSESASASRDSLAPPEVSSSSSSSPSPTPSPGQFGFSSGRPLSYFDTEESPWADAQSATPVSSTAF